MYDYSYYDTMDPGFASGIFAAFGGMMLFSSLIGIFMIVCMWKIFTKAGKEGWKSIIPIYNIIVLLEIVELPIWYIVLYIIPFINIYALFKTYIELAHKFGKSTGFGVLMIFFGIVCFPILAFDSSAYQGGNYSENTNYSNTNMNTNSFNNNLNNYSNTTNQFNGQSVQTNALNSMNQVNSGVSSFGATNNSNNIFVDNTATNQVSQHTNQNQMNDIFEMPTNLNNQQMNNQPVNSVVDTNPFVEPQSTTGSMNTISINEQSIYTNTNTNSTIGTQDYSSVNPVNNPTPNIDLNNNNSFNSINTQTTMNSTIPSIDNNVNQAQQPFTGSVNPEVATKACPNCGAQVKSDSSFCFMCGKQL